MGMIARVYVIIIPPFIQNAQKAITVKMVRTAEKQDEEAGKKSGKKTSYFFEIFGPYESIIITILISNNHYNIKYNY